MATTKIADGTMERMKNFREEYGISFKHIVTQGAEMFMDQYEDRREGDSDERVA